MELPRKIPSLPILPLLRTGWNLFRVFFEEHKWAVIAAVAVVVLVFLSLKYSDYYYTASIQASTQVKDKHSFQNAVDYLESVLDSLDTAQEKANVLIQIGRLYQSGKEGEVVPDLDKAVGAYTRAYEEFGSQLAGMELGGLYQYETESPIYNPRKAELIYINILMYYAAQDPKTIDPVVYSETRNHLSMLQASRNVSEFQDFDNAPEQQFQELGGDQRDFTLRPEEALPVPPPVHIPAVWRRPAVVIHRVQANGEPNDGDGEDNGGDAGGGNEQEVPVFPVNPDLDPITGQYRNDPQNTHDHGVVQSIRQSITNLNRHTDIVLDIPSCFQQIREFCRGRGGTNYTTVLDQIERSTSVQGHSGMRESEVLQLVWNRILMLPREQQEAAKHNLALELEGAVDYSGKAICGVGRTNRIVDSLNVVDPLVTVKPKWVLNQEMMDKAAQIRRSMIERLPVEDQEAIDAVRPTPEQEQVYETFYNQFKAELLDRFRKDYVDNGLIDDQVLVNELEKWVG